MREWLSVPDNQVTAGLFLIGLAIIVGVSIFQYVETKQRRSRVLAALRYYRTYADPSWEPGPPPSQEFMDRLRARLLEEHDRVHGDGAP